MVNCHLALHGGEKIGNIMITNIDVPLGRIQSNGIYTIEGEIYRETPPYTTYKARLSEGSFGSLLRAWRFAQTVKECYGGPEEAEMLYRAFFTIAATTDSKTRDRLSDGPWTKDLVMACEYISLEFDHFLRMNSRRAGLSKQDLDYLERRTYAILHDILQQALTVIVGLFEEMMTLENQRSLLEKSFCEIADIKWRVSGSKLGSRLNAIEAALGERVHTSYKPSLGISLEFYQVG